ncbi:MAG: hypothetical protein EXQ87_05055 [Alphaproteobacteria bacterium]|nr:hypothetical protein [Alphaproteobacteria bacterium]
MITANFAGASLLLAASSREMFCNAAGVSLYEKSGKPTVGDRLEAAESLAGERVTVVAVDMPMAHTPIVGRRVADKRISVAFGSSSVLSTAFPIKSVK